MGTTCNEDESAINKNVLIGLNNTRDLMVLLEE